jgi:hypothetical protein
MPLVDVNPFLAGWLSLLMDYLWLIVAIVVWTIVQTWLLPRLGVPT